MTEVAGPAAGLEADTELVEASRARLARALPPRDRRAALAMTTGFLVATAALAAVAPSDRSPSPLVIAVLVAVYALTSRAEFEVGTGVVVPTQLVFVPMLFLLPLPTVPLCVAAGLLLGRVVEIARGRVSLDRALLSVVSSSYALGPAAVLAIAGERAPSWSDWPLYAAALAAQFGCDYAAAASWEWLALGVRPTAQARFMTLAYAVDAALAPIGFVVAFAAVGEPAAVLLALPLVGLLAEFAANGRSASTTPWSSGRPTVAPRCCSATSSTPTTPTRGTTAATSWSSSARSRSSSSSRTTTCAPPSSSRCSTTWARSAFRPRSSASPAR